MPLQIIIAGAGLVGLSAAIALGRQGHKVDIYEKSSFKHEVGAAIHVGPMAQRCLASWDVDLKNIGPVEAVTLDRISITDDHSRDMHLPMSKRCDQLGIRERQLMVHRVDLHQLLLEHAEKQPTVTIHLGQGIRSVDSKGKAVLADGSEVSADVIVGADGVHSVTLAAVDKVAAPEPAQQTMYRFLIPTAKAQNDSRGRPAVDKWVYSNRLIDHAHFESSRHLVIYPCQDNTLLNAAVMQPIALDPRPDELEDAWNNPGSPEDVLEVLHDFPEDLRGLISLAEDVKHWRSVNRDCPRTFVKDNLVLVGDAAHPMKPTYGAGAGIGIEDAAALGILLGQEASREDVGRALETYNKIRYSRGVTVKYASEPPEAAKQSSTPADETLRNLTGNEVPKDVIAYILGEDPLERANQAVGPVYA